METAELFQRFSLALAIGLLIGIERGWHNREEPEGERAAGLRTHTLSAVLGAVWGAIAGLTDGSGGGLALAVAFAVFGAAIVLFRYRETGHDGTFGATTVVAALLAFSLGAYAILGDKAVAAATGVAVAGLLALKAALHEWVRRLTWVELRSGLVLAAMTFILLPVLPNRAVGPLGAVNPFEIWLLTVMIAAISFAGYLAIKLAGERRGIVLTGIAGGLASSTAVTLTLARVGREHPAETRLLTAGAMLAGATMMLRVLGIVAVVNSALLSRLLLPLLLGAAVTAGMGLWLLRGGEPVEGSARRGRSPPLLTNPLDLPSVLKFAALLTIIGVASRLAMHVGGNMGTHVLAAISGLADVDAITLSYARLAGDQLGLDVAATAIGLAVAVNSLAKGAMSWFAGGPEFGRRMLIVAAIAIAVGLAAFGLGPLPF